MTNKVDTDEKEKSVQKAKGLDNPDNLKEKSAQKAKGLDNPDNLATKAAGGAIHVAGAAGGVMTLIGGIAAKIVLTAASVVIAPVYIIRDLVNRKDPGESAKQGVPKLNTDEITRMHDQASDSRHEDAQPVSDSDR